jgi:hypothetical protein
VIEIIVAGLGLAWLTHKAADSGDKAIKSGARAVTRSAKRVVRDVAQKVDDVRPACARGKAPHQPHSDGVCYSDGELAISCRQCGVRL